MKQLNKAIRTFSLIFILYAVFAFIIIIHFVPWSNLLLGMSILTIVGFLIAVFYSLSITKPMNNLGKHIRKIAEGDFSATKYPLNQDFSRLFNDLNNISSKLEKDEIKLSRQKEGFNIIIESIKEAIWIQDNKGFIRTYNSSFSDLVQETDLKNQYFWNVIRIKELYSAVDEHFKKPASKTKEIGFDSRHFLFSTSYSELSKETVFILYDITEFRQLKTIKKDFVLNVSHELRTPLTSIKGYLETFEDDLEDEYKSYIDVIKRNTDRLIYIVNDLLTLSSLEHNQSLQTEIIRVDHFLEGISKIFAHRLENKKLELIIEQDNSKIELEADRYQLEQVFINLIDNAVKYTEKGEIKIIVVDKTDKLNFVISDRGNGISKEHLPRLFERFYVVDKSRSRSMGGTGLGLSIVKHIVNLHGGTINVESTVGIGTKFLIVMPKTAI